MADFKTVLERAHAGYSNRDDYPPFAIAPWDDRPRWNAYLEKINAELDVAEAEAAEPTPRGEG